MMFINIGGKLFPIPQNNDNNDNNDNDTPNGCWYLIIIIIFLLIFLFIK